MKKEHLKKYIMRKLPGVDTLLTETPIKDLIQKFSQELVVYSIRSILDKARADIQKNNKNPDKNELISQIKDLISALTKPALKPMINATGVVIHTNLGRAPLGNNVLKNALESASGYCNLEFNLKTAKRGHRNGHLSEILKFLTQAEDAIVVNNNAAAIILILNTFSKDKETIVSRGELIEIGGSFRIPEIMSAAGAVMRETGTTNRTRISDYEKTINEKTALLFKAHQSNFAIKGFTEEAGLKALVELGKKKNIPVVYDIGSGLLRKPKNLSLSEEPDVRSAVKQGADLVCFSGDKLLGGPQAGIICGKKELIRKLAKAPMMRALRVGKLTIAALAAACENYLTDNLLAENTPIFNFLERTEKELLSLAEKLKAEFEAKGFVSEVIKSQGQCGGGTLPELKIDSFGVKISLKDKKRKENVLFAEKLYQELLNLDKPVLGILRQGNLVFDVLTLNKEDIPYISIVCSHAIHRVSTKIN
ncbi:L-seryl-tRNA(Sec) selenium transferase [Candidatus Margulisiibacteriota bacterium]